MKERDIEVLVEDIGRVPRAAAILEIGLQDVATGELTPADALRRFERVYSALRDEHMKRQTRGRS